MKTFKKYAILFFGILAVLSLSACGKYDESGGLGTVTVIKKGAFIGSTGGGVEPEAKWPGTHQITSSGTDYDAIYKCYTPRTITLKNFKVVMENMKNQELKFTISLTYMTNPLKAPYLYENFKSSQQEIKAIFQQASMQVLNKINMGLDNGNKKSKGISFESREVISKKILTKFVKDFNKQYPQYIDSFVFIDCATRNVDYDVKLLAKMEKAVAKVYEKEMLKFQAKVDDLKGQIEVAKSQADLEAYGKESGALDDDVLAYMGLELVEDFASNNNILTKIVIPLDENGNIDFLNVNH